MNEERYNSPMTAVTVIGKEQDPWFEDSAYKRPIWTFVVYGAYTVSEICQLLHENAVFNPQFLTALKTFAGPASVWGDKPYFDERPPSYTDESEESDILIWVFSNPCYTENGEVDRGKGPTFNLEIHLTPVSSGVNKTLRLEDKTPSIATSGSKGGLF